MSVYDNYQCEGQMSIFDVFDQDTWSGKTSPEPSAQTKEKTLEPSSKKRRGSQIKAPLFLDLRGGQKWSPSGAILGDGWSVAWRVHDAQFWGVPQRRKRISLVADFGGQSAPEILFERESVSRDLESSGETRQGTSVTLEGDSFETISFQERSGCPGGAKESSSNTNEQEPCQPLTTKVFCLQGNGIDRAETAGCNGKGWREDESYTLNTIDRHAVCCSQDAYDKFTENDKSASLKAMGGTYGGGQRSVSDTVGALCRCDYKGVGNQYVADGKVIIQDIQKTRSS